MDRQERDYLKLHNTSISGCDKSTQSPEAEKNSFIHQIREMRAWFHTLTDKSDNFFHSWLLPGCALAAPMNLLSTPTASQSQQKYQPQVVWRQDEC